MIVAFECLMKYHPNGDCEDIYLASDKEYEITLRVNFKGAENSDVIFEIVDDGSEIKVDSEEIIKIKPV